RLPPVDGTRDVLPPRHGRAGGRDGAGRRPRPGAGDAGGGRERPRGAAPRRGGVVIRHRAVGRATACPSHCSSEALAETHILHRHATPGPFFEKVYPPAGSASLSRRTFAALVG